MTGSAARAIGAFASWSFAERWRALHVAALAAAVEVGVRIFPLPSLARALNVRLGTAELPLPGSSATVLSPADLEHLRAVRRVFSMWNPERNCLRRSLVLAHLLRRHRPLVQVGVARYRGQQVRAHAWVEIDGRPIGDGSVHKNFRAVTPAVQRVAPTSRGRTR